MTEDEPFADVGEYLWIIALRVVPFVEPTDHSEDRLRGEPFVDLRYNTGTNGGLDCLDYVSKQTAFFGTDIGFIFCFERRPIPEEYDEKAGVRRDGAHLFPHECTEALARIGGIGSPFRTRASTGAASR